MSNEFVVKNGLITPSAQVSGSSSGTTAIVAASAASGTLTLPSATDTLVGKATTDTLTNKSISGSTNTLTNIPNSALTNTSVTIGTTSIALGASSTTLSGLTSVSSTSFTGALTGNADTATTATNIASGTPGALLYQTNTSTTGFISFTSTPGQVLVAGVGAPYWGTPATATTATNVSGGTASVTTLSASSTVTLSGGTANGVAYLNGSNVLTTGTALAFDGSTLSAPTHVGTAFNNYTYTLSTGSTTPVPVILGLGATLNATGATSVGNYGIISNPKLAAVSTGGSSSSGIIGISAQPAILSSDAGSYVYMYGLNAITRRGSSSDLSSNTSNVLFGIVNNVAQMASLPSTAYTGQVYGISNGINIASGTVGAVYAVYNNINIASAAGQTSAATSVYGYQHTATIGNATGTAFTVGSYYGMYLGAPTVGSNATITNRYGIYQADTSATNYIGGTLNVTGALTQNSNQVLHAGNYTSYSPSLTGSGASGTWGINVTGTAAGLSATLAVVSGGTGVTTSTGTGSVVLSNSPTLVTPALGTPSALVGTNITGTAAGLSIGGNAATATTATNVSGGTSSVTSETVSGNLTLSGGTANGVAYLNGSKVVTTGSALTFDGTSFGIGGIGAFGALNVQRYASSSQATLTIGDSATPANDVGIYFRQTGGVAGFSTAGAAFAWYNASPGTGEQMRLTSTGLGIGTSSPAYKLDVNGVGRVQSSFIVGPAISSSDRLFYVSGNSGTSGSSQFGAVVNPTLPNTVTSAAYGFYTNLNLASGATVTNAFGLYIDAMSYGTSTITNKYGLYVADTNNSYIGGNLGIGTSSPATKLNIGAGGTLRLNRPDNATYGDIYHGASGTGLVYNDANGDGHFWQLSGTTSLLLNSSGNLGLGVTPTTASACTNIELPYGATLSARSNTTAPQFAMSSNAVGNWYAPTYKISAYATQYTQQGFDGTHKWYNAPSGTAGNAITFTQAMTLDASGRLMVGTTTALGNAATFYGGSNTVVIAQGSSTGYAGLRIYNDQNSSVRALEIDYMGSAYSGGEMASIGTTGAYPMVFSTSNTERLRIGSAGQIGLSGANYGTAGQVLTSGGASAAPTWATASATDATKLPLAGGTLTGTLTLTSAIGDGVPALLITPSSSSGATQWASRTMASSLTAGQQVVHLLGKLASTNNSGYIAYKHSADGSASNFMSIGLYAADNLLNIYANGTVQVGSNTVLHAANYNSYSPTLTGTGASGTWGIGITGAINGLTLNQERTANARLYSATTGAMGLLGVDSGGTYKWQVYGDGSYYGFLDSAWGNWDIQKTVNGQLNLRVSSSLYTVLHAGNYSSYALPLSGGTLTGTLNLTGSINHYLYINPGNGYEAMVRYNGGSGSGWYVGKRMTAQTVGTESFHFYSEAAAKTIAGFDTSGNLAVTGAYMRPTAGTGYLNGQYPNAESVATSGAIYSIGGSYVPGTTTLGNMYGIGYGYSGNAGITATGAGSSLWGMYVASAGTSRIFLDSDNGRGFFNSNLYSSGNLVLTAGNYSSYALPLSGGAMTGSTTIGTSNYIRFGPNPTWASTLQVGGDGRNAITNSSTFASVVTTNGNLHLDSGSDKGMYLNFYSGTAGINFGNGASGFNATMSAGGVLAATNVTIGGNQVLHAGNYSSYALPLSGGTVSGNSYFISNFNTASGSSPALMAYSNNGSGACLSFHRGGYYAVNMGLDSDNVIRIGGWSAPTNRWQLDMSGNGYYAGNIYANGNLVLNASNYNSYSPTLTGTGASGTWGINITGSSASTTGASTSCSGTAYLASAVSYLPNRTDGAAYPVVWGAAYTSGSGTIAYSCAAVTITSSTGQLSASILYSSGNVTAYSDERVKTNWRGLGDNFVLNLSKTKSGVYDRTDCELTQVGVSAQSLQEFMPDAVTTDEDGKLSVSYGHAALTSAVELAKEVVDLRARVAHLEELISNLIKG